MGDQVKKISFGFSKLAKKTAIVSSHLNKYNQEDDVSKVELIDCLEGKSIKLKDPVKLDQGPLIIPLSRKNKEKSSSQQEYPKNAESLGSKNESHDNITNSSSSLIIEENEKLDNKDNINETESQSKNDTLDEIAEREILEELKQKNTEDDEKRVFSVPLTTNAPSGEKESTLEDYDDIPVSAFGMAMLRGMGWAPGKGIGKTEKLVTPTLPTLRPKGMGLGADKVIKSAEKKNSNEELKMVKGSYVRVLAGPEKDGYGQIEGFDDESGRLIIKLALKNVSISLNEFMVQLVDTNEFKKNSKVLNVSKYERYKEEEVNKESTGKSSQEIVLGNKSENPAEILYSDKTRADKEKRSSSCGSEEGNLKSKRAEASPELHRSRGSSHRRNKSSRSPNERRKESSRSLSRSDKYESVKPRTSSKYTDKNSTGRNKKSRAYSSDSSDSSSNYRTTNRSKIRSKSPLRDRSVSRRRSMSNSSASSDSLKNYSRKGKDKHKKKSSSNKYRSRSRSRSPRKHKHKKSKKYR